MLIRTDTLKFLPFEDSKFTKQAPQFIKNLESKPSNESAFKIKKETSGTNSQVLNEKLNDALIHTHPATVALPVLRDYLVKIPSTTPIVASSAGTNEPICAMTVISATCLM